MGYGLAFSVPVLINRERHFDAIADHYRAFDLEPGPRSGMDLVVDVPADNRFSTFLELIQKLDAYAASETVLVVNHGMSDAQDNPLGLILPLTTGSAWNPEEYTLGLLAGFIGKNPSDDDYAQAEKNSSMTVQQRTIPMSPGTLKPLDTALRRLRGKKLLKRLEIRACNLGGNQKVMKLLVQVLGLKSIVAPRVHMFYGRIGTPGPLPDTAAGFLQWQRNHPRARTFTDPSSSRRVGIQVTGKHAFRTIDFDSTDLDVKWFLEKFVCPGNTYVSRTPGRGARINTLSFSGMDIGNSFALAQEHDYVDQLVEVTP